MLQTPVLLSMEDMNIMRKGLKDKQEQDHNDQDNECFEAHDISSFNKRSSSV